MTSQNKQLAETKKPKFSVAITTDGYKKLINNTLGDPNRAKRFTATITSAVAVNQQLQECDAGTILAGALLGESLNLSPSPQLGQFYLVPFKSKAKYDRQGHLIEPETTKAQFILGYKGYLQLAMRSGQLKKINAVEIKQGELIKFDPLNEEIEVKLIEDWNERELSPTIGYYVRLNLNDARANKVGENLWELEEKWQARNGRAISYPLGFNPTFHKYRLDWPKQVVTGSRVFVCSMADMFGEWVPDGCL